MNFKNIRIQPLFHQVCGVWASLLLSHAVAATETDLDWGVAETILQRIVAPSFPDRDFVITDFGAVEGGEADSSVAIRRAIVAAHESGGGRVVVPEGTFFTGPVHLLSNVNLHLREGARLLFSTALEDYLPAVYSRWEGVECYNLSPLVYAYGQRNIALTGKGILDGQASDDNWWIYKGKTEHGWKPGLPLQKPARDRLFAMGEAGVPVEERQFGVEDYLRPSFVQFYKCENILIEGVTIERSPMWEIHPVLSRNITVRGVTVISHGPNNDGCNPESCQDVLIENCLFDTGDDCIAIKSGRNNDGRRVNVPSQNIIIRHCRMKEGHGGVVLGSEISGGVRNVFVEDCEMDSPHLDRALRIKTNSVRGGLIENIYVRNIRVGQVGDAVIKVNFLYEEGDVGDFMPVVRNIVVENLSSAKSKYALFIQGYPHSPVRDIQGLRFDQVFQNSGMAVDQWGAPLDDAASE